MSNEVGPSLIWSRLRSGGVVGNDADHDNNNINIDCPSFEK